MRERRRTHFFILFFKSDVTNFSFISRLTVLKKITEFCTYYKILEVYKRIIF
jgi:hypothetical protein